MKNKNMQKIYLQFRDLACTKQLWILALVGAVSIKTRQWRKVFSTIIIVTYKNFDVDVNKKR